MTTPLAQLDHRYLWHPFTQMQEWMGDQPVIIESGEGAVLRDVDGREYLDANSSIWTNLHGHRHPKITAAINAQLGRIAHSSFLGLSNVPAIQLAEQLVRLVQSKLTGPAERRLTRVFFSDDGSTAIEAAIKMALQYWRQRGQPGRHQFIAFANAYHGDTLGAVSVGGIDLFHATFKPLLFDVTRVSDLAQLRAALTDKTAAVVIEPLVQGAAGMKLWPRGWLRQIREVCDDRGALLIADEVLTGFGRTGTMFACEQESVTPDLMALAKGLTGGYLPLAATLATDDIFNAFMGTYAEFKTFFHGHSYTGNQLGCAAALANLQVFEDEAVLGKLSVISHQLAVGLEQFRRIAAVVDIRHIGCIAAVEMGPYPIEQQMGWKVCDAMRQRGVLTRPIGNTIVLMPPYCVSQEQIDRMLQVLAESIGEVCRSP